MKYAASIGCIACNKGFVLDAMVWSINLKDIKEGVIKREIVKERLSKASF